jgi:hypothetical protein
VSATFYSPANIHRILFHSPGYLSMLRTVVLETGWLMRVTGTYPETDTGAHHYLCGLAMIMKRSVSVIVAMLCSINLGTGCLHQFHRRTRRADWRYWTHGHPSRTCRSSDHPFEDGQGSIEACGGSFRLLVRIWKVSSVPSSSSSQIILTMQNLQHAIRISPLPIRK